MSKINWKVRLTNKVFWLTIIPAVLLLVQSVLAVFGVALDLGVLGNQLIDIVNSTFVLLAIAGVVADPTTAGMSDSAQALTYTKPKESE